MEEKVDNPSSMKKHETREKGASKKKITIVDEDNPRLKKKNEIHKEFKSQEFKYSPGNDPRFQQQNQTQRCFVMYTDFYRCQHILGEGSEACTWFKDVFTSICPKAWVEHWDELRLTGRLPWHKYKTQGAFPGNKYGE
ncbi:cytochrome c oxidase subunit 6B1 [Temnothorax americanus]|uniref:cytochrome c oxidase subunit 6B1 n=1 Tax=Temnothorax americanus TaxID=1964332 RepID=UPI004067E0F0